MWCESGREIWRRGLKTEFTSLKLQNHREADRQSFNTDTSRTAGFGPVNDKVQSQCIFFPVRSQLFMGLISGCCVIILVWVSTATCICKQLCAWSQHASTNRLLADHFQTLQHYFLDGSESSARALWFQGRLNDVNFYQQLGEHSELPGQEGWHCHRDVP